MFSAATPTSKNHICHYFCLTLFVYSFRLQLSIDNYRLWAVRKINKSHQTSDDVQYFFIYFLNFFFLTQGYQSTGPGIPTKDPTPDYRLIRASEENGYTNIQFERIDTTEGDDKDVQFTVRSETYFISSVKNRENTK